MGRVLSVSSGRPIPSQDMNLSFRMIKLAAPTKEVEEVEEAGCIEVVSGLFWQNEVTEEFDVSSDITEQV